MKEYIRHIAVFAMLCLSFFACVDPYNVDITTDKGYLLIDGTITDLNEPQIISISRTPKDAQFTSSQFTSTIIAKQKDATPVSGAIVTLLVNEKETVPLKETTIGNYELPTTFKGKIGNTYQIKISTPDGQTYQSTIEKMYPVSKIKQVYDTFNKTGIKRFTGSDERISTSDIYLDYDDLPNEKNFYRWNWVNYEIQNICETCKRSRYNTYETETGIDGECFRDLTLDFNSVFDYICDGLCWDIFYSSDINIFSDIYTDGQPQKGKLVAQIPLRQSNACLVNIQQMSLTPNAYRYFKLIQDQSVNVGTLADTPPAPIRSNIINLKNNDELVLGYFTASSVSEVKYMLNRKNTTGGRYNGLFQTITNRLPNYEPEVGDRADIPLALCKKNKNRTPYFPEGWKP